MPDKREGGGARPPHRVRPARGRPTRGHRARLDMLEWQYVENVRLDARVAAQRSLQDLRRRRDGSPSAAPPHPMVPLAHWATIQEAPDGGEYSPPDRLRAYQDWLRQLRDNGLYDGPVELTFVNGEGDD